VIFSFAVYKIKKKNLGFFFSPKEGLASVFEKSVYQMESGMSKIDEVMEIKALRRVISAYLK